MEDAAAGRQRAARADSEGLTPSGAERACDLREPWPHSRSFLPGSEVHTGKASGHRESVKMV